MAFKGMKFVFDNQPCDRYDLMIATIGRSDKDSSSCGTIGEIVKDKTARQNEYSIYGINHSEPLKIDITFFSKDVISRQKFGIIQKWLEVPYYAKLQVVQEDMQDSYYNCIFTKIEAQYFNGNIIGLSATAECSASWSYSDEKVISLDNLTGSNRVSFYNQTDDHSYVYPTLTAKVSGNGDVSVKNVSDNDRTWMAKDLKIGDEFVVNSELQTTKTLNGLDVFPKCNHKWLRLVPGQNVLEVSGSFEKLELRYVVPQKRTNN